MNAQRFHAITSRYATLHCAVMGDFCLDRYLEINPSLQEISIETGLPVHNVVRVRSQPGGAGTILNNLISLGLGRIHVIGLAGEDGEGWELRRALAAHPQVNLEFFHQTSERHTFTYTKPLLMEAGTAPVELSRLDLKNWDRMPATLEDKFKQAIQRVAAKVDALILLEQVDRPETGVLTQPLLKEVERCSHANPNLLVMADSRRGLAHFPAFNYKMNADELARYQNLSGSLDSAAVRQEAGQLARQIGHRVIVTMADQGMLGADPSGQVVHAPAFPLRGEIDIVGAGDAVTANLTAALAAGAELSEALEMASAAASIVIHQLGTTGTASVPQISNLLSEVGRLANPGARS